MRLDLFDNSWFSRGRAKWFEALWIFVDSIFVSTAFPGSSLRCFLLRLFGSELGRGVVIKPRVHVKFPWRLRVGDYSWIGEGVWIDNLGIVEIGEHSVVSQGAYFCTGSHDWSAAKFDLIVKSIHVADKCWVGAYGKLAPGVTMETGSVLSLGSVATGTLKAWSIYQGNPATLIRERSQQETDE